jgi:DNA-binding response OmpR family regulator
MPGARDVVLEVGGHKELPGLSCRELLILQKLAMHGEQMVPMGVLRSLGKKSIVSRSAVKAYMCSLRTKIRDIYPEAAEYIVTCKDHARRDEKVLGYLLSATVGKTYEIGCAEKNAVLGAVHSEPDQSVRRVGPIEVSFSIFARDARIEVEGVFKSVGLTFGEFRILQILTSQHRVFSADVIAGMLEPRSSEFRAVTPSSVKTQIRYIRRKLGAQLPGGEYYLHTHGYWDGGSSSRRGYSLESIPQQRVGKLAERLQAAIPKQHAA